MVDGHDGGLSSGVNPVKPVPEIQHAILEDAPEISGSTESAWAAVAKSIMDVDEQKIRDYKEYIDTI